MDLRIFGKCELQDIGCTKGVALVLVLPRAETVQEALAQRVSLEEHTVSWTPTGVKWHISLWPVSCLSFASLSFCFLICRTQMVIPNS